VLRMGNIQDGMLNLDNLKYLPPDHPEFPRLLLTAGDLLFNRTNSAELVGKTAVYRGRPNPCSFASYLIRVRLLRPHLSQVVANALNGPHGRAWVASVVSQQVGQANVNGTKLRAFPFPLPPETEQEEIVRQSADAADSVTRSTEAINALLLHRAAALRQSILKRAFTGRLVSQDLADEPASVLLERIRAEREGARRKSKHRPMKSNVRLTPRVP
ncbi:MAG: restriction endonuclease subunit S, partial [Gemmatimonadetes bacterium]|nr:restriction endonuclease subunit S [Candidatus Palauibacter rhopaloidicola]